MSAKPFAENLWSTLFQKVTVNKKHRVTKAHQCPFIKAENVNPSYCTGTQGCSGTRVNLQIFNPTLFHSTHLPTPTYTILSLPMKWLTTGQLLTAATRKPWKRCYCRISIGYLFTFFCVCVPQQNFLDDHGSSPDKQPCGNSRTWQES